MGERYVVKATRQAQEQLREIVDYVSSTLQAPEAAFHLLDALETAMTSLSRFPDRIALTEEEPWHSRRIHKMPVQNFIVYFWIDKAAHRVQVTAVVYGRRDQTRQLAQMEME